MKVLFGDTTNAGTTYYRMRGFQKGLQGRGAEVAMVEWHPTRAFNASWEHDPASDIVRCHIGRLAAACDVAVFQICHSADALALVDTIREQYQKPVLFESDDFMFGVQSDSLAFVDWHPDSPAERTAMTQLMTADGVIVSTEYLAAMYGRVNPNVHVVHNGIDPDLWPKPNYSPGRRVRIGWQGGASHDRDFEQIKDVVLSLATELRDKVEWHFQGGVPNWCKNHKAISCSIDWVPVEQYPAVMQSLNLDIGIAPLCDSTFARSKSDLRFLEFSALGIPTVATDCPAYNTVQDGVTGMKVRTPEEWASAIRFLVDNHDKRRELGLNARQWVMDNRTIYHSADEYLAALEDYGGD